MTLMDRSRRLLAILLLAPLVVGVLAAGFPDPPEPPTAAPGSDRRPASVAPALWEAVASGGETRFLVVLREQADLSPAARLTDKRAKGRFVVQALREVALRTQPPLWAFLERRGASYRPFYVVNMLAVTGDRALVEALAAHPLVARLEANPAVAAPLPRRREPPVLPDLARRLRPAQEAGLLWNLSAIGADAVWALGYRGQGVVVAGQDTGYQWDHPALIRQYRGWNGTTVVHDYNWHDAVHEDLGPADTNPCGYDSPVPCDDHGHGTHTMGTMVGDDGAGNQIGVAPEARWIGCRNMDNGWGSPATYAECFEFFLAPYPVNGDPLTDGDPDMAPDVINNSWACPAQEGCSWTTLQQVVENVRAAGILVVASAGNEGPTCGSVQWPPALYEAAFSVGATDSAGQIASFSSRGPVTVDGSNRPKPDLSAPGVDIRSSVPKDSYQGGWSGTSMAGPHVAGAVALLWSASPDLRGHVTETERLLRETARPVVDTTCGGDADGHPNNVYGWGIVDAWAAVQAVAPALALRLTARPAWVRPGRSLTYTFAVTNTTALTQTGLVLTDRLPLSVTLAAAAPPASQGGGVVTWTWPSLASRSAVSAALVVTVGPAGPGTRIVNGAYGVRSTTVTETITGTPIGVLVPWSVYLPVVLRPPAR
ncbi:MAG TPA: DUF11 domain-containing protein [Chloroflexi bacterium]|nr:DUF11 domain-containing protein [Chloroflexota bacterium]